MKEYYHVILALKKKKGRTEWLRGKIIKKEKLILLNKVFINWFWNYFFNKSEPRNNRVR